MTTQYAVDIEMDVTPILLCYYYFALKGHRKKYIDVGKLRVPVGVFFENTACSHAAPLRVVFPIFVTYLQE